MIRRKYYGFSGRSWRWPKLINPLSRSNSPLYVIFCSKTSVCGYIGFNRSFAEWIGSQPNRIVEFEAMNSGRRYRGFFYIQNCSQFGVAYILGHRRGLPFLPNIAKHDLCNSIKIFFFFCHFSTPFCGSIIYCNNSKWNWFDQIIQIWEI